MELPVILRHKGRFIPATARNISCGGMFISSENFNISEENSVEIVFDLDEKKDLSFCGRITRLEKGNNAIGIGVQFTKLSSDSHGVVEEFIGRSHK